MTIAAAVPSRVAILGISGSGKSELGRALARRWGLPLVHADTMEWGPQWTERAPAEVLAQHHDLLRGDRWLIEGWIDGTKAERLTAAELVIDLDLPGAVCAFRAARRMLRGRRRPEMPEGCVDRWSWTFLWIVLCRRERGAIDEALAAGRPRRYLRFRSRAAVRQWVRSLG